MTENVDPPKPGPWILFGIPALAVILAVAYALFVHTSLRKHDHNTSNSPVKLQTYLAVEDFKLTDQHGKAFSRTALDGKVWIANFIFTSCAAECPVINRRMMEIQERFADNPDVALVSISVDPQTDTPERLNAYAEGYKAGPRWHFLTGKPADLDRLIKHSFLLPVARSDRERAKILISNFTHSEKIAVVDPTGIVRFYAEGLAPNAIDRVSQAITLCLDNGTPR